MCLELPDLSSLYVVTVDLVKEDLLSYPSAYRRYKRQRKYKQKQEKARFSLRTIDLHSDF